MSETLRDSPIRLYMIVLHYLHRIVVFFGRIIFTLVYGKSTGKVPAIKNPLLLQTASDLAEKIRNRKITSEEVVDAFIARIEEINPVLNCVVEKNFDQARSLAKQADKLARENSSDKLAKEKPLLGVPFTTKDCIAVEGLHHTGGLVLRRDVIAEKDAECVRLVRAAGAIPLGLTNVSELCMWWESHNYVHGRTNNPYDTTRIVGGSSGGEGCNQAAAGSAFGIGSDIGGSIRMPCFFNGVFGHKPSKFIVSNDGQFPQPDFPLQSSFLGLGPMCRKACDLKPLLKILAGENASKLNLDKQVDLKSLKVYYQLDNLGSPLVCPVDPEIKRALMKVVNHLSSTFNLHPEEKKFKRFYKSVPIWTTTMKGSKTSFIEKISGQDGKFYILKELVKNLFGRSGHTMIALFTGLFEKSGAQPGDEIHQHYLKVREELEKEVKDMLGEDGILIYPTHPTPAPYHDEPVIRPMNFSYTAIVNCLGLPATHVPMGLDSKEGLPIGIQVIGNTNNDRICLAVAEELDKAFGGWVQP